MLPNSARERYNPWSRPLLLIHTLYTLYARYTRYTRYTL